MPELLYEDERTHPSDSYCLQNVGGEKSVSCQNPANLSTFRPSGTYCFKEDVLPSYQIYNFYRVVLNFKFLLNYTVQLADRDFTLRFSCDALIEKGCTLIGGNNTSVPTLNSFFPIFDAYLVAPDNAVHPLVSRKLIFPSAAAIYPYTPFSTNVTLVDSAYISQYLQAHQTLDCRKSTDEFLNKTTPYFPSDVTETLLQLGADLPSAKFSSTMESPLFLTMDIPNYTLPIWSEFYMYIPNRNWTAPSPPPDEPPFD